MNTTRLLEELIDEIETMENVEEVVYYLEERLSEEIKRQETQDILKSLSDEDEVVEEDETY